MRVGRRSVAVLIVAATAVWGAIPGHAFAGDWVMEFPGVFSKEGSYPRVAMTQYGEAVVAYRGYGETIRVSRHPPNATFSGDVFGEPVFPEPGICCFRPEAPAVAVDSQGDIAVVWQQGTYGSGKPEIYASFSPQGGSFSPPQLISLESATLPEVAMDERGDATVVWLRNDGIDTVVEAATAAMGGSFSPPVVLSGDGGDAADVQVAIDPEGDAIASWLRTSGARTDFEVAVRQAGGTFPSSDGSGDGTVLGEALPPTPSVSEPPAQHVAMRHGLEAVAVWETAGRAVQEARMASGDVSFGQASTLGTASALPSIAMNQAGEVVIDWPTALGIDVATAPPRGTFGSHEQVLLPEGTPQYAKISLAPDGQVALAWVRDAGEQKGFWWFSQGATTRLPGGAFEKPTTLGSGSSGADSANGLEMAGDSLGNTLAVWQETTTIGEDVRSFVYDNGPTLTDVNVPSKADVGEPVSVGVAVPITLWQPLTSLTWSFGDGSSASGPYSTHIYTAPGTYTVSVSAADAQTFGPGGPEKHVENTASQTIVVSAAPIKGLAAPTLSDVRESRRVWQEHATAHRARARKKGAPMGVTFSYTLDERANVRFAFTRLADGHIAKGHCSGRVKQNGRRLRCGGVLVGDLSLEGRPGPNKLYFQGQLASKHWLRPGHYRVTVTANNSVGRSPSATLSFTIVRAPHS